MLWNLKESEHFVCCFIVLNPVTELRQDETAVKLLQAHMILAKNIWAEWGRNLQLKSRLDQHERRVSTELLLNGKEYRRKRFRRFKGQVQRAYTCIENGCMRSYGYAKQHREFSETAYKTQT